MKRHQLLKAILFSLHQSDRPVGGCRCRLDGPTETCPAWPEAARYHEARARRMLSSLIGLGAMKVDDGLVDGHVHIHSSGPDPEFAAGFVSGIRAHA